MDGYLEVRIQARDRRRYSFCLLIPEIKGTKILNILTSLYRVVHNTCIKHGKRHQDAADWVDINLDMRKGLKFYQIRSNAIILQETLPAYCIPKVVRLKIGEVLYEKSYMSLRPPPKDLFTSRLDQKNWVRKLIDNQKGKLPDNQKEKLLDKQNSSNQPNQLQIQFVIDQGDLMKCKMKEKRPRSQEISVNSFNEELGSSDWTGRPSWNRGNSSTFIWRQQESQCWADSW